MDNGKQKRQSGFEMPQSQMQPFVIKKLVTRCIKDTVYLQGSIFCKNSF